MDEGVGVHIPLQTPIFKKTLDHLAKRNPLTKPQVWIYTNIFKCSYFSQSHICKEQRKPPSLMDLHSQSGWTLNAMEMTV